MNCWSFAVLVGLLGIGCVSFTCHAQVLTTEEQRNLLEWVAATLKATDKPTAIDLYHGVQAATGLSTNAKDVLPASKICTTASAVPIKTPSDAFYLVRILQAASCSAKTVLDKAQKVAAESINGIKSIPEAYFVYKTLAAVKSEGVKVTVKPESIEKFMELLKDLTHSSGALRAATEVKLPSFAATGMAYSTLAAARDFGVTLKDGVEASIDEIVSSVPKVFGLAKSDGGLWSKVDDDHLESTALFLEGTAALEGKEVDPAKVAAASKFVLKYKSAATLKDAWSLVTALKSIIGSTLPTPVVITPVSNRISVSGTGSLEVKATTPLGTPASCQLTLVSAVKDKVEVKKGVAFTGPKDGVYSVSLVTDKQAGSYSVTVEASECVEEGLAPTSSATFPVVVTDAMKVSDVSITTGDEVHKVVHPKKLGELLSLDHQSTLKVAFKLVAANAKNAVVAQQAFVVLTHGERGVAATVAAKAKGDVWTASLTSATTEKQLGTLGGVYSVSLLVSDKSIEPAIKWPVADVTVAFQPTSTGAQPAASPLPVMEDEYKPKKEILHVFRAPEIRPPAVVSTVFTALTLAPWLVLLVLLGQAKANLKALPTSGAGAIAALCFLGGILAILGLYAAFWTVLNLMQTLPILLGLGIFTILSGYYSLSQHASSRLKND